MLSKAPFKILPKLSSRTATSIDLGNEISGARKIIAVIKLRFANNLIKGLLFEKEDKRKYKTNRI